MKKFLLLTILLGTLSVNSFAQASSEKVIELFRVMKTDKMMDAIMDNMMTIMVPKNDPSRSAEHQKVFTEFKSYASQEGKLLMKKIINGDMLTLYSKHFTNDEIQKYIDFYATPAGIKMLDLTPVIQKEFMTSFMTNDMPAFQLKLKAKLDELHKQYPDSNPQSPVDKPIK